MVRSKKLLSLSIFLFIIVIALNLPFPNRYPSIEKGVSMLNIPIKTVNGFHVIGILSIVLIFICLYALSKSLSKYKGRMILATIVALFVVPMLLVNIYQSTVAKGIYAISYENEESTCDFDMIRKNTLNGECVLYFKNHSNEQVKFFLEFQEERLFKDDPPMISMMNAQAPYEITLSGNEEKTVHIDVLIDVSHMENYIESGSANGINIIIQSNDKLREL